MMGDFLLACVVLYYARDVIDAINNVADAIRDHGVGE